MCLKKNFSSWLPLQLLILLMWLNQIIWIITQISVLSFGPSTITSKKNYIYTEKDFMTLKKNLGFS
jgi:hypothetical protein